MAVQDLIFKASAPKVDVLKAVGADLLLDVQNPLMMLDRTNKVSFQNLNFTFVNDPPEPTGVGADQNKLTLIHSFKHGYDYIPAVWFLGFVSNGLLGGTRFDYYTQDGGILSQHTAFDTAQILFSWDATNVNVYVDKYYVNGFGATNDIRGVSFKARIYVFANDVGV